MSLCECWWEPLDKYGSYYRASGGSEELIERLRICTLHTLLESDPPEQAADLDKVMANLIDRPMCLKPF